MSSRDSWMRWNSKENTPSRVGRRCPSSSRDASTRAQNSRRIRDRARGHRRRRRSAPRPSRSNRSFKTGVVTPRHRWPRGRRPRLASRRRPGASICNTILTLESRELHPSAIHPRAQIARTRSLSHPNATFSFYAECVPRSPRRRPSSRRRRRRSRARPRPSTPSSLAVTSTGPPVHS